MPYPPLPPLALHRWVVVDGIVRRMSPRNILEIGCGMGAFGARLAARYDYIGVELDATSFEVARERIEPFGGRVVHGMASDVGDRRFELVCAFEVLEHIEDDSAALREWTERLSPGGHLLISVPVGADRFGPSDTFAGHYRRYDPGQLETALEAAGLCEVKLTRYGWPLGYVTEGIRNRLAARREESLAETSLESRTAKSGRWMQPGPRTGVAVKAVSAPFCWLQSLNPEWGVGLVALASRQAG